MDFKAINNQILEEDHKFGFTGIHDIELARKIYDSLNMSLISMTDEEATVHTIYTVLRDNRTY